MKPCITMLAMVAGLLPAVAPLTAGEQDAALAREVAVTRFRENPLITVDTSVSLGANINGPTVIRVPDWVSRPLGRYYMYFAHHAGTFIRMAYADAITGPWKIYEPGVLHVRDTAFFRPPPNENIHVASPEIFIDTGLKRLVMWFHGWWTDGKPWPQPEPGETSWDAMVRKGYDQFTQAAESSDGIHFEAREAITRESYLRVFQYGGYFYGMTSEGALGRSRDPLARFEFGRPTVLAFKGNVSLARRLETNPFREYSGRVREVALLLRGGRLYVFFTAAGDAPESVLLSTIDLSPDWTSWRATSPVTVLQPETSYECADLPVERSQWGMVETRVRQIHDPFVFEERGKTFLFYTICGEQGIAGAEITLR